jgi:hypothetical protein
MVTTFGKGARGRNAEERHLLGAGQVDCLEGQRGANRGPGAVLAQTERRNLNWQSLAVPSPRLQAIFADTNAGTIARAGTPPDLTLSKYPKPTRSACGVAR